MRDLDFLLSPYLLELPLRCISKDPDVLSALTEVEAILLIDIVWNKVYLIDKALVGKINGNCASCLSWGNVHSDRNRFSREHNYRGIEIEINTHCNHRCRFCPTAYNEQPTRFMSVREYRHIIAEVVSCGIENVSLNHYSEPTLHPNLIEMVAFAAKKELSITLFTNGSGLTSEVIRGLAKSTGALEIVANIPECNENDYQRVTQSNQFSRVVSQILEAVKFFPVKIVVNNPKQGVVESIAELFPSALVQQWETDDRAGILDIPSYTNSQKHASRLLNGCSLAARFINVSVDGDVFLCAQDYYKANVFGNIHDKSLWVIFEGHIAQQYRKWIFGAESPPKEFICRRCRWTRCKTAGYSIGQQLSNYDLEVYSEIVHQSRIIRVSKTDKGIEKSLCGEFRT